jgi:hypothetical protein
MNGTGGVEGHARNRRGRHLARKGHAGTTRAQDESVSSPALCHKHNTPQHNHLGGWTAGAGPGRSVVATGLAHKQEMDMDLFQWLWCQLDTDCCRHLLEGCVWRRGT